MKNKLLIILSVINLGLLTSCREDFDAINQDPNRTTTPLTYGLFNSANKELMDGTRNSFESGRVTLPWVQYSAQRNYTEEDRYQYRITSSDALWNTYYYAAQDYKTILDLNSNPNTKGAVSAYGPNENQIAASRVMLAYIFYNLADTFGDVPYYSYGTQDADFQALNMVDYIQPKFAPQAKIYADILKELKAASEMVKTDQVVFTSGDLLFGNGLKLKRFANSLRLKIATRVKGVVPDAETHITEAISSGVMLSNEDTVGIEYQNDLINPSPMYIAFFVDNRNDISVSSTMVNLLKGITGNFGVDPRLQKYAAPVGTKLSAIRDMTYTESNNINDYSGQPYGLDNEQAAVQNPYSSSPSYNILKKNYKEILMEYAEVEFLLSEAKGWDDTHYRKGVRASMERWNVDASKISTFIASLPVANKANVLTQKYVALFWQPYEAWAEYRRTGYPDTSILLLPGETGQLLTGGTYKFTPLISLTDLPARLFYPIGVQTKNAVNYKAAISSMGADEMSTKLIWDKN